MDTPTQPGEAGEAPAPQNHLFPDTVTVLGVRLLPLSLGRYRLLRWAGSPFVAEADAEASIEDLFAAVAICGMPVQEFRRHVACGTLHRPLSRWGRRLRRQLRRERGFTVQSRAAIFARYVADGQALPWVPLAVQSGQDPSARHWSDCLEGILKGRLNWSKEDIDEEPLTKALAEHFGLMEAEGAVRLIPRDMWDALQEVGRENARLLELFQKDGGAA